MRTGTPPRIVWSRAAKAADVLRVYDQDDWRALSRRLALKVPYTAAVRSHARPLLAACAILLIVVGVLLWFDYWA